MSESITDLTSAKILPDLADGPARWLRSVIFGRLADMNGQLQVHDPDGSYLLGQPDGNPPVRMQVNDLAMYTYTSLGGEVGVGQAYILALWQVDDLVSLARLFMRNRDHLNNLSGLLGRVRMPLYRWIERKRRNSVTGSKRNIAAHYDLGNDLFALFLDETMTYSSAIFRDADSTLAEAQRHKYDLICRKLHLRPGQRLIEIGTGWGGFAMHAASHYGVHVTTTTISRQQFAWAQAQVERAGLSDRIELLEQDYRRLEGSYDRLVSIEMIEAVGHQYLPAFMQKCDSLLKPDGQALIQAITIRDQLFDSMRNTRDYIREFIFPGGMLPSVAELLRLTGRDTGMRLFALDDYAQDYARTLKLWRESFLSRREEVLRLGYDDEFIRMWEYYLAACEGGFDEQVIGLAHLLFVKDRCRRAPVNRSLGLA